MTKIVLSVFVSVVSTYLCSNAQDELPTITDEMIKKCEEDYHQCENVPGYPTEVVNKIIEEHKEELPEFVKETLDDPALRRKRDYPLVMKYCDSEIQLISPQIAKTKEGVWVWVYNSDVQQTYRFETCVQETAPCSPIIVMSNKTDTRTLQCSQQYIYRDGLVIPSRKNKSAPMVMTQIRVKGCCQCEILG